MQDELLDSEGTGFFYTGTCLGTKKVAAIVDGAAGDGRASRGANYWWAGHNASIKAAFGRITPAGRDLRTSSPCNVRCSISEVMERRTRPALTRK